MTAPDTPFTSADDLSRYIPFLMTRLSNRWATNQNAALTELGLNGTMFRILASLSAYDQLTINQLSTLSVTEQSTTSRTVEQLVSSGHVDRLTDQNDQRVRTVILTEAGRKTLHNIAPLIRDLYRDLLRNIPPSDLETCITVLKRMADNIGESGL
jgi:DNA-binding MarR family transcriptional regulator